jgi:hypothetical protein
MGPREESGGSSDPFDKLVEVNFGCCHGSTAQHDLEVPVSWDYFDNVGNPHGSLFAFPILEDDHDDCLLKVA